MGLFFQSTVIDGASLHYRTRPKQLLTMASGAAVEQFEAGYGKYFGNRFGKLTDKTTEDEIKKVYKEWATQYDQDVVHTARVSYHKPLTEAFDAAIKQAYPDTTKSQIRILDAGAGTGLVGEALAKLGYTNVDALDISQEMLDEAEKKKVYTKFFCAPLNEQRNPEIETGAYHALVCVGTLLAAHVRAEALDEMIRMVKNGGIFCFNVRNEDIKEYEEKMLEMEKTGQWKMLSKEKMPYFNKEDLPKENNTLIYKVLKNE